MTFPSGLGGIVGNLQGTGVRWWSRVAFCATSLSGGSTGRRRPFLRRQVRRCGTAWVRRSVVGGVEFGQGIDMLSRAILLIGNHGTNAYFRLAFTISDPICPCLSEPTVDALVRVYVFRRELAIIDSKYQHITMAGAYRTRCGECNFRTPWDTENSAQMAMEAHYDDVHPDVPMGGMIEFDGRRRNEGESPLIWVVLAIVALCILASLGGC